MDDKNVTPGKPYVAGISEDYDLERHIQSFTASSDRIRHVLFISIVASILIFAAYRNSHLKGWTTTRLDLARVALRNKVWSVDIAHRIETCRRRGQESARFLDDCRIVRRAYEQLIVKRLMGKKSLEYYTEQLEEAVVDDIQIVEVPFLGIHFDINDLGAFSASGLAALSMIMCFSMARHHENLYLCLWKVRNIARSEGKPSHGQSKANFLYHSLAMAQVFTRPPTLARWNPLPFSRYGVRAVLFSPLIVQAFVLSHDLRTIRRAWELNPRATIISMGIQVGFFSLMLIFLLASYRYSSAGDRRWRETFFTINPEYRDLILPSWFEWTKLWSMPRWCMDTSEGGIFFGDLNGECFWEVREKSKRSRRKGVDPKEEARHRKTGKHELIAANERTPASLVLRDGADNIYSFQAAQDKGIVLIRTIKGDPPTELAGGHPRIVDGRGADAGFLRVSHCMLFNDAIYITDGPCIRKATAEGSVKTILGGPSRGFFSSRQPRLGGLTADGQSIFVTDGHRNCVWCVKEEPLQIDVCFESKGSWSPLAIAVEKVHRSGNCSETILYVLEGRRCSAWGIFCRFVLRLRPFRLRRIEADKVRTLISFGFRALKKNPAFRKQHHLRVSGQTIHDIKQEFQLQQSRSTTRKSAALVRQTEPV